jgi:hypothetical protein
MSGTHDALVAGVTLAAKIGLGVFAALALAQGIRTPQTNPPVTADLVAPSDVKSALRRSCYDCHSNETRWPWYGRVAPISWLLSRDVKEGRKALNFSSWGELAATERAMQLDEIAETVAACEMPLWYYLPMHPDARLSPSDEARIVGWARSARQTQ